MSAENPDWQRWRSQVDVGGYDERWQQMADAGQNPHGEADLVCRFAPAAVLDAGCGTGRVAIELAARGIDTVGVDLDPDMLAVARAKAADLAWVQHSLAGLDLGRTFDVVVLAGNVIPFVNVAERADAVAGCARHLGPGGRMIAGFQLRTGWPTLDEYDGWCRAAGLDLEARHATWDGAPMTPGEDYAVSIHLRSGG